MFLSTWYRVDFYIPSGLDLSLTQYAIWAGADVGRVLNYECCLSDVDCHGGFRGSKWEMVFTRLPHGLPSAIAQLYMVAAG